MDTILTKNAQSVQDVLVNKGVDCKVLELSDSTRTASDAAATIGCDISQIVKSLVFRTKTTQRPVLILASGPNRVNEKTIELHVGEKITKADADFTRAVTGFPIGGIPPIGHKTSIDLVFIDEGLLKLKEVWAAAGTPNAVFNLQTEHLLDLTRGKVISIQ